MEAAAHTSSTSKRTTRAASRLEQWPDGGQFCVVSRRQVFFDRKTIRRRARIRVATLSLSHSLLSTKMLLLAGQSPFNVLLLLQLLPLLLLLLLLPILAFNRSHAHSTGESQAGQL